MNFWLFYPIEKAVLVMRHTRWELRCHMLRIGPIAICIVWKRPRQGPTEAAQ